jgi:hypothetical protein
MADNKSPNGAYGLILGALAVAVAVAFLLNGGDRYFGKKPVEGDKDLPPVQMAPAKPQ